MAKYLNEDQVGFDSTDIGFPNLSGCMAVVLLTEAGLFGFHMTPGNARKSSSFATFINHENAAGRFVGLYASCYVATRYQGSPSAVAAEQWQAEMQEVAAAIGYHGTVHAFDASQEATKVPPSEPVYIEYRRKGNACETFYKRMGKMNVGVGSNSAESPIRRIVPQRGAIDAFQLADPFHNLVTQSASVASTWSNLGSLHKARGSHTFRV